MQESWAQLTDGRKFGQAIKVQVDHTRQEHLGVRPLRDERLGNSMIPPIQKFDASASSWRAFGQIRLQQPTRPSDLRPRRTCAFAPRADRQQRGRVDQSGKRADWQLNMFARTPARACRTRRTSGSAGSSNAAVVRPRNVEHQMLLPSCGQPEP